MPHSLFIQLAPFAAFRERLAPNSIEPSFGSSSPPARYPLLDLVEPHTVLQRKPTIIGTEDRLHGDTR